MNALVRLDTFASIILMSLDLNALDDVEALFESYMHEGRAVTTPDETQETDDNPNCFVGK